MFVRRLFAALFVLVPFSVSADQVTTIKDRTALTLTVYQQNLALIHEVRRVALSNGREHLVIQGVPSSLIPASVLANGATAGRVQVFGQIYESALLSPEALLKDALGKTVQVITVNPETGAETFAPAKVLRTQGREALLRLDGRIRTIDVRRIAFDSVPENLRAQPTLAIDLASTAAGDEALSLRYLTGGLSWKADYVAQLSEEETEVRLAGWVTLNNATGTSFRDARLRVVAGSVNRAGRPIVRRGQAKFLARASAEADSGPVETAVSDLRVFDFEEAVTIGDQQTRQLALLSETTVKVAKEYRLEGNSSYFGNARRDTERTSPVVRFRIENKKVNGLGRSLPGGTMRLYASSKGGALLRGEDAIRHTPVGESATITAGRANDITSERRQTDFRREGLKRNAAESAHSITLRNAKKEAVTVSVVERIPGDWRILSESQTHTKRASNEAIWRVVVPAGGEAELTYRVRTQF